MSIKIACISPDNLSTLIFCRTLSRLLDKATGISLITLSGDVEGQPRGMYKKDVEEQVRSTHIDLPMRRFVAPLRDIIYFLKIYSILKREHCSAVITFTTKPNIYGQFASFLAGIPLRIMAVRGLGRIFNTQATTRGRILQRLMAILYCFACKAAHKIWFTNQGDLDHFVSLGVVSEQKAFLTRNAVDPSDFSRDRIEPRKIESLRHELGIKEGEKVVIMVARLIEQKGVREFAEAAVFLKDLLPRCHCVLVAPQEPDNPSMVPVSYIRYMESISNLRWLGFRKDVRELYALSDLAVLASYYKEGGYPRALLEAMAFGKPVIAADTPECRGPVEHGRNGYLVPPRDSKALADAIERILNNPALAQAMGECSLARIREEFDDRIVFNRLINEVILRGLNARRH